MADTLTACFVGLGSIGKRHLANLHTVAKERGLKIATDALRHDASIPLDAPSASLVRREYTRIDELGFYDLLFICNPSQLHYETLLKVMSHANRFFIEKPLFTRPLTDGELSPLLDERKFYVACPLRHTPTFADLSAFTKTNSIYAVRAICSSYLPDWRPGLDYRKLYSAAKDSGGVAMDLIHEFDYLFSLFGMPSSSSMVAKHVSHLEIESHDVVAFVADYPDMTLELHLDYFGRTPQRYCEIYTDNETRHFDFLVQREDRNESCLREMRYFLDFANGISANINSPHFANAVIGTALVA